MTSRSNRLGMFADVREVLDSALAHGGGSFQCATHGDAIHWRQRAYRFRKLYAETIGPKAMSPYDVLVLPRVPDDSATVIITVRQTAGIFTPAGPRVDALADEEDLMAEAQALLDKLGEG